MLVKNWMSDNVITIEATESMQKAMSLMREHKVRMLPVMREGDLVGIVSDTDLKRASASDATSLDIHEMLYLISRIRVQDIMTKEVVTVPEDYTIEETAQVLMEKNISGAPVVDSNGRLAGMITRYDLFKVLIDLSGFGKRGVQFAFLIEDRSGSIKPLTDTIRSFSGRIASILTTYEYAPAGKRLVYLRVYEIDRSTMPQLISELKRGGVFSLSGGPSRQQTASIHEREGLVFYNR